MDLRQPSSAEANISFAAEDGGASPTYIIKEPPKKLNGKSANSIGADNNRYEYDEMTSKFRTNTVENSQMFDGAREQLKDDDFKYRKVSERESVETARQCLQADYRGGEENLFKKEVFDGSDSMLDRLISLKTGKRTTTGLSLDKLKAQARGDMNARVTDAVRRAYTLRDQANAKVNPSGASETMRLRNQLAAENSAASIEQQRENLNAGFDVSELRAKANALKAESDNSTVHSGADKLHDNWVEKIESKASKSIESFALKGISKVTGGAGKVVEKIPVINKSQIDENLIKAGDWIANANEYRIEKVSKLLTDSKVNLISPFVENIETIDIIYNKPRQLVFDTDNIYVLKNNTDL